MLKKWSGPCLSEIHWKISDFNFSSLEPLICGASFLFWLSHLPEWPNQLAYFTFINGFSYKFSEKLKICSLEPKLWPSKAGVKKFLEFQNSNAIFKWLDFISVKELRMARKQQNWLSERAGMCSVVFYSMKFDNKSIWNNPKISVPKMSKIVVSWSLKEIILLPSCSKEFYDYASFR